MRTFSRKSSVLLIAHLMWSLVIALIRLRYWSLTPNLTPKSKIEIDLKFFGEGLKFELANLCEISDWCSFSLIPMLWKRRMKKSEVKDIVSVANQNNNINTAGVVYSAIAVLGPVFGTEVFNPLRYRQLSVQ